MTIGNWMSTRLADMRGEQFQVGDRIVRATKSGQAVNLEQCKVTRIDDGKLYLNDSKVAVNYPGRLLIVNTLFD